MEINYADLKLNFLKYLAENPSLNIDLSKINELSIFSYSDEFQNFLSDEYNVQDSIFSFDLSDLLDMSFEDGKFVIGDTTKTANDEATLEESNNFLLEYLNDFLSNEDIKEMIDTDGNGELSDEEVDNFFKKIATSDEIADGISLTDIKNAFEQIQNGTFKDGLGAVDVEATSQTPETPETPQDTTVEDTKPRSNGSSNGDGNYDSGNDDKTPKTVNYSSMSLEDLKAKQTEKSTELGKYQDAVSAVYSGKNEAVSAAEKDRDEKKAAYETALSEDESISDELKQQALQNNKDIEAKEAEISTSQEQLNQKESEIYAKTNEISNLESTLGALEASKSKLEAQKGDDKTEDKALVESKLQEVNDKITEVTKEKERKEGELKQLNTDKDAINDQITQQQGDLSTLKATKQDIDAKIRETGSKATTDALTAFNDAAAKVDTVKEKELATAQKNLTDFKKDFDDLNNAIREKEAKQTQKEYKVGQADLFSDAGFDIQKVTRDGMDYIVVGPKDADPNEELPVMVYLHGSGETGNNLSKLENASLLNMITEHTSEFGETFNGYIIMPQTPTSGWTGESKNKEVRQIVSEFSQTHAIDEENITIAGHSMGGIGALYMAGNNDDNFYSRALVLSGYNPGDSVLKNIHIPVFGVSGSGENNSTNSLVASAGSKGNYVQVKSNHGSVPRYAFGLDADGNGKSDLIEWLYPDYAD